jgi:hypothetical protein
MRCALLTLVLGFGCHRSDNDFPIGVGGPGPGAGGPGAVDAAPDGRDASAQLSAHVCLLIDPRDQTTCAGSGAGGLTVTLGTAQSTTADDGTFTINRPSGSMIMWAVTGTTVVPSISIFSAQTSVPAMPTALYAQLLGDNGVVAQTGQGDVFLRVASGSAAVTGATATIQPAGIYGTFYDGSTPSNWTGRSTGAFGAAWMPQVTAGTATVTVTPQAGSAATLGDVPVVDGTLTFLTEEIP